MRPILATALALAGCRNACQQLCVDMADFAEECGYTVSKDQLKACFSEQSNKNTSKDYRNICRDETENLREEWTCDEITPYFEGGGGDTGSSDDTGA